MGARSGLAHRPTSSDAGVAVDVGATRWRRANGYVRVGTPREGARVGDVKHILAMWRSYGVPTVRVALSRGDDPLVWVEDLDRCAHGPRRTGVIDTLDWARRTSGRSAPNACGPTGEVLGGGRVRWRGVFRCGTRRRGRVLPARGHRDAHDHAERQDAKRAAESWSDHVVLDADDPQAVPDVLQRCATLSRVPIREDCRHFESRTYEGGEVARFCVLDLAPEAPWRCPENCPAYERSVIDPTFETAELSRPPVEDEPEGSVDDIEAVLADAEAIVEESEPEAVRAVEEGDRSAGKRAWWRFGRRRRDEGDDFGLSDR